MTEYYYYKYQKYKHKYYQTKFKQHGETPFQTGLWSIRL